VIRLNSIRSVRARSALCLVAALAARPSLLACATCFGASDSDLARGMNWGILSLLVVVVGVLSAVATFFVYVARRTAALASRSTPPAIDPAPKVISE